MGRVVGIDLGTTNSVVAVMEGGKPVVIANAEGMRTTPSVVGISKEEERLIGQMARRQSVLDPQNTFYSVKRFIGRKYSELNPDSKQVSYTIRKDEMGNIKIKCPRLKRDFAPEEISAMVLKKLADEASRYLGEAVTGAVITVPAYFNDSQRQATRDAGRIAGLDVKRILNEPTAASLAYGLDRAQSETILVFDLGGGTFDVSILEVGDGVFEVKATSGDTQLGGGDFDQKIVDFLAEQFLETEGIDLRKDRQSLQRLTEAAEKAKIELSGVTVTEINLPFITATADGPKHIETRMTRSQFEGLCGDLLSRLRNPVRQALRDTGLPPSAIDEIVLVGGGTRMPMVQELVRSLINRPPNQNVNPDEVVAVGAAIQAGILAGEVKDILLLDVTPLSLGLETIGGVMKKLIPRNTTIPVRRSDIFSTGEDNQTMVEVHVVQGEREMAAGNKSLGRFKLMGIPPAPRGIPQIQVAFDIDANGILQVTAMDRTTGREQSITIQGASNLSEEEVRQMIRNAEEFGQADRLRKEKVEKRNKAEASTFQAERLLKEAALDYTMGFVSPYRAKIEPLVQRLRESLADNDDRAIDMLSGNLRDAIADLNREIYQRVQEEDQKGGFFESIKDFFLDDEDDYEYDRRDSYDSWGAPRRDGYDNTWNLPRREPNSWDSSTRRNAYDDRIPPRRDAAWETPRQDPYSERTPPRDEGSRDAGPRETPSWRDAPDDRTSRRDTNAWDAPSRRPLYDDRSTPDRTPYDNSSSSRRESYDNRTPPRRDPEADRTPRRNSTDNWSNPTAPRNPRDDNWENPPRRGGDAGRSGPAPYNRDAYADREPPRDRPRRPRSEDDYPNSTRGAQKRPTRPNYDQDNWDDEDDWV